MIRRLKHTFLRLSSEEKVTAIGSLLVLIGAFLPWYQVNLTVDSKKVIETGFSGDLGVIGFVVFLITLLALLTLVGEHMRFRMPTFGYQKEKTILFLMAQSSFLLLLIIGIYTKRSLDFTNAELRFGLYVAFIGAILAMLSSYALIQKFKKRETQAFFDHPEEEADTEPIFEKAAEEPAKTQEPPPITLEEWVQEEAPAAEQSQYFMREAGLNESSEAETEEEPESETEPEPETEIETEAEIEIEAEVEEEAEAEPEEETQKKAGAPSLNFYED